MRVSLAQSDDGAKRRHASKLCIVNATAAGRGRRTSRYRTRHATHHFRARARGARRASDRRRARRRSRPRLLRARFRRSKRPTSRAVRRYSVQFDTSPNITKRLAGGESPDVLIAQASTVEQMIKEGRAIAASRTPLGRIGVGRGDRHEARSGRTSRRVDALKASLLQS